MKPTTRDEAIAAGSKTFYPSGTCKHGHDLSIKGKFVKSGTCKECSKASQKIYYAKLVQRVNNRG